MKCKYREILMRGRGETARMFSVCKHEEIIKQFEEMPVTHPANEADTTFVKLRCSLVCEDCLYQAPPL